MAGAPPERDDLMASFDDIGTAGPRLRRILDGALAALPPERADLARTAACELVTNALVHAESEADLYVTTEANGDVRVQVVDFGPGVPVLVEAPAEAERGRGLMIVATTADRWGVVVEDGWKAVWFEVAAQVAAPS